jgi:formate dehydrogenase subunit gamma
MSTNTMPLDETVQACVAQALAQHGRTQDALLPILHAVQGQLGHVPPQAVPLIAKGLSLSRAEVHGVVTYYHFFRSEPPGRHVVQVCMAESCKACGGDALMAHAERVLGCASHSTRADGAVTLEPVYCLGLCAASPAMQVNDQPHARVTPERFEQLVGRLGLSTEVTP